MTRRRPTRRDRLQRHPMLFGALIAGVLAATTLLAAMSTNGVPMLPAYDLTLTLPADAPAMRAGAEVRVAGLVMGVVKEVEATPSGQRVRFGLRGAAQPVGADARVTLRLRSPAGQHYLALDRGSYASAPLRSGEEIPSRQVARSEDLLDVVEGFKRAALRDLGSATRLAGTGLAGRGTGLNTSLAGLDRTLSQTTAIARASTPKDDLTSLVRESGAVARGFAGLRPGDTARATTGAARTFGAFAARGPAIRSFLRHLPGTEDEALRTLPAADLLLIDTATLAQRLTPAARAMRAALPGLADALARGPVLRRESTRIAPPALAALRGLGPVVRRSAPSAQMLGLAFGPLGPFSAYLAKYERELDSGFSVFAGALTYLSAGGQAPNTGAAPAMLIFTCARGSNPDPKPGELFADRMEKRCQ